MNIKRLFPECCLVLIMPPSMQELERRLRKRGTETEEKIIERTAQAREELKFAENYDYLIVNGELSVAVDDLKAVIAAEKLRKAKYQKADYKVEIKNKDKRSDKSQSRYNDSSLAKIGGGGLTAARYDVSAHQLSEAKKQSKLLQKIAENTERQSGKSELLMK